MKSPGLRTAGLDILTILRFPAPLCAIGTIGGISGIGLLLLV